jgi:hypothetical protein
MRILYIADGRSPIALNWISYFVKRGDEVHLATTFPAQPDLVLSSLTFVPLAFSSAKAGGGSGTRRGIWGAGLVGLRTKVRQWLGPLTIPSAGQQIRALIEQIQPDLVHAMRIPYEGMAAAAAMQGLAGIPLLISVWGNDFTLHARSSPWMASWTRQAMRRANALHSDCQRDVLLAREWGFGTERPVFVAPGNGGVNVSEFRPENAMEQDSVNKDQEEEWVINPRGVRAYVRNDVFFKAIPLVLAKRPKTRFVCLGMQGSVLAEQWVRNLGVSGRVELLPTLPRTQLPGLFRRCAVVVSPTTHDGTPNTLLEALACGCFPVAGDLVSIREWIEDGRNGLLVDPGDAQALAQAILLGLEDEEFRKQAQVENFKMIAERAEYGAVMGKAAEFYKQLALSKTASSRSQ